MQQPGGFIKGLFFGNYFYGTCAIMLSIEAALQQYVALNPVIYYIFLFAATVLYYTKAYITPGDEGLHNKRSVWYAKNRTLVYTSQIFLTIVAAITGALLLKDIWYNIPHVLPAEWFLLAVFPVVALLYYGINYPGFTRYNLRNTGWLKPFIIGFVWGGTVTVYPILFWFISTGTPYHITLVGILLLVKNIMFISVLCIMFDIKDYAADHNLHLQTFVVRVGLRKTIFVIIIPLSAIGLGTFILFAVLRHFPVGRILINTVPFVLLIIVAYSLHRRKSILYYLAIIDGLMLVKAICGIIGISIIK